MIEISNDAFMTGDDARAHYKVTNRLYVVNETESQVNKTTYTSLLYVLINELFLQSSQVSCCVLAVVVGRFLASGQ